MRRSLAAITLLTVAAVTTAACRKAAKPRPAETAAPAAAPAPAPAAAPMPAEPEPPAAMRTLAGRLAYEAAHRPDGTATVEDVVAALGAAGVQLAEVKQYVALTAAARYCAGGRTADGLAIAVCEYESAAAAAAGRDHVEALYARVPGRQIAIRGATTLTTTVPDGADLAAQRARAEAAFAAM